MKNAEKVLDELKEVRPEKLTGEAKRLFEAIMKIADERDELLKERQADKEKIKELEEEIDDWKFTKNYVEDNYIHKNEIKRKIEEVEIELENYEADKINVFSGQTYMEKFKLLGKLYILKELLEE